MGVNTRITLEPRAGYENVATVVAILLGCKPTLETLGGDYGLVCHVVGLEIKPSGSLGLIDIQITPPYGENRSLFYHFEFGREGKRGLLPRSSAINIALGVRLVEFFGGGVDFHDSDDVDCDFNSEGLSFCNAEDGAEWGTLQQALFDLRPITMSEALQYEKFASYKLDGSRG